MSREELAARALEVLSDFALETHSLFARYLLYGCLFTALVVAAAPLPRRGREWVIVGLSIASLAMLGTAPLALIALGFAVALYLAIDFLPGPAGHGLAWLLIAAQLTYPALLPRALFTSEVPQLREFWAFATNVWLLRCVAYLVDRRSRGVARRTLREYLLATLFFPTFVNGPIESTEQLAAHRHAFPAIDSWRELRRFAASLPATTLRLAWGSFKVLFGVVYLGQDNPAVFATAGRELDPFWLWLWTVELYASFYVIFSGWSDVAIVLARWSGYAVAENFDAPWKARSVTDFWRRWHISFGRWLRDYIYIPLGGNRRHSSFNVVVTFVASGLWHVWGALKVLGPRDYPPRAWLGFVAWGVLNGLGVIAARWWNRAALFAPLRDQLERSLSPGVRFRLAQGLAFTYVALAWIPFFLPPWTEVAACGTIVLRLFGLR